jgi:hypothetical protein
MAAAALALGAASAQASTISTFENVALSPDSHYFPYATSTIIDGAASFEHRYSSLYGSWSGWTISNETDKLVPGFDNQFSAYADGGAGGSSNFALAYVSAYESTATAIEFAAPVMAGSVALANNTYTALSMQFGDDFAKKFGGDSGNDADWLLLSIVGKDALGAATGTVDFYLADYRFADNSLDYIVSEWTTLDLSSLGLVSSLEFQMSSSDTGAWGINTPTYFALDDLSVTAAVPEPSTWLLVLAGLGLMPLARRVRTAR